MDSRALYEAFVELGSVTFDGQAFRHVAPEFDCHSAEGARVVGGRWNPPNSFPALYTAVSIETAAAELGRLAENQKRPVERLLPRRVCVMRLNLMSVLDIRGEPNLSVVGLSETSVRTGDLAVTQAIGEAAFKFGLEGIIAPSATGVGDIVVVFPLNLSATSRIETVGEQWWRLADDLPA